MDSEAGRALEPGRTLGHYRLLERIGAGGMGEVWRARDTRLERDVALKVLLPGTIADDAARKRFRHEALALSRLNHPHIATVFDFDSDAGHDFLVMEYVGGVTLGAHRSGGPLAEPEVVRLGLQLAEGLAAAHHEGIVHRDLKPANLRLTTDGRLKILDFGLAHLAHAAGDSAGSAAPTLTASLTESGALVGTLGYMAPEQLRGEKTDARTDLWATGLVLYELATGRRAHADAGSAQLMYAILNSSVAAPRGVNPLVSDALEAIVLKCLEKDPANRYASARELAADLTRLQQGVDVDAVRARRRSRRARSLALALPLAAVLLLVALTAFDAGGLRTRLLGGGSRVRSIAVLPLANLSNDPEQEYFADGLTEQLINDLGQVGSLRIISRTSAMQYKDSKKGLRQIARELSVDAVVEGSVSRAGDRVRVSAQLIHATKDRQLWGQSYDRELRDALALQNEIASAIVAEVRATTSTVEQARLQRARTVDPAVLDAILRGRHFLTQFNAEAMRKSLESFRAAVDLDPGSAEAYAGLAQAYLFNSSMLLPAATAMPSAAAAARRALQLDPDNAEAQTSLAYVRAFYEWRWKEAEPQLRRAIEVAPSSVAAHCWLAYFLVVNARLDEAKLAIRQACALDPLSSYAASMALWPLFEGREYEAALDAARRAAGLDPSNSNAYAVMGQALTMLGRHDEACAAFRKSRELGLGDGDPCSLVDARRGDRVAALRGIDSLINVPDRDRVPAMLIAEHYAALGNRDEAFRWLETSVRQHGEDIIFLKVDPFLDPLRSDPRFAGIVRQVFPD